jgi:hypothetical protein
VPAVLWANLHCKQITKVAGSEAVGLSRYSAPPLSRAVLLDSSTPVASREQLEVRNTPPPTSLAVLEWMAPSLHVTWQLMRAYRPPPCLPAVLLKSSTPIASREELEKRNTPPPRSATVFE